MKNAFVLACVVAVIAGCAGKHRGGLQEQAGAQTGGEGSIAPVITDRGSDFRVWRTVTPIQRNGRTINRTNSYVEMATGLYYLENGEWKESRDEITVTANGAEATKGRHKVHFAGNINSVGAITVTTPDNQVLRSHVVGLAYTDLASGQSTFLAQIQNSDGLLVAPNEVAYPNAFGGVVADLRYAYTKRGLEQDVILRQRLPSPATYNFNPETTVLEVWTEFVEAPEPAKTVRMLGIVRDETLNFGGMRMGRGNAFALGAPANRLSRTPVGKTWIRENNRTLLVESVPYKFIVKELAELPVQQAALNPQREKGGTDSRFALLQKIERPVRAASPPIRKAFASSFDTRKGLVLDYVLVAGSTNDVTFQADTTYFIKNSVDVFGTATFEGGTVLKYNTTNNAWLEAWGNIIFKTDAYRPAIFTSRNDRTVGEDLWLSGSPTNYYRALSTGPDLEFKHLRISYANEGISSPSMQIRDAQFTHCQTALYTFLTEGAGGQVDNALFYDIGTAFGGGLFNTGARNVTINQCA